MFLQTLQRNYRMKFSIILLLCLINISTLFSQNIKPQWQKERLSSYCYAVEIMDHAKTGYWIAFWGVDRQLFKQALIEDSLTFIETDSSIIFEQDILSKHEIIFDKNSRFIMFNTKHVLIHGMGYNYSQKLQKRFQTIYDDEYSGSIYKDNGFQYTWILKDSSGDVSTLMTNDNINGYYEITISMKKDLRY